MEIFRYLMFVIILLYQGKIDSAKNLKVINGVYARFGDINFIVSIQYQGDHIGCGSVVAPTWVLTVKSILVNIDIKLLRIRYAVLDCYSEDNANVSTRKVVRKAVKSRTPTVLLKVDNDFLYDLYSGAAKWAEHGSFTPKGEFVKLFGWPQKERSAGSNFLIKSDIYIDKSYSVGGRRLHSYEFYAGGFGVGVREGCIGAPLVWGDTLIGVASHHSRFDGYTPDVYYRLSSIADWVNSTINGANILPYGN